MKKTTHVAITSLTVILLAGLLAGCQSGLSIDDEPAGPDRDWVLYPEQQIYVDRVQGEAVLQSQGQWESREIKPLEDGGYEVIVPRGENYFLTGEPVPVPENGPRPYPIAPAGR